jgi:sensor domain CHASE-containing protein
MEIRLTAILVLCIFIFLGVYIIFWCHMFSKSRFERIERYQERIEEKLREIQRDIARK